MDKKTNNRVEEEFRSSHIYKVLKGSGIPAADAVAQGLNKAAAGIDGAVSEIAHSVQEGASRTVGDEHAKQYGSQGSNETYSYKYSVNNSSDGTRPQPGGTRQYEPKQAAPAPQQPPKPMKMIRHGSPAKFYITGAAALLYAMSFPMYETPHYIVYVLALIGVFFLSGKIFKGKKEFVPIEAEETKVKDEPKKAEQVEKTSKTGNPEVDKIIDDGNEYLQKLREANDAIPDEALSEDIDRMERASADIFRYISEYPEKAQQIRKFMNYYLPTTLKLLNSYQRLSAQSVKGENITSTMFNIAGMMHTVADAFEKQLDALFSAEAMDISADISVFETLLKQEGFVEEKK